MLVIITLIGVMTAHVLLNTNWLKPEHAYAAIKNGGEGTSNDTTSGYQHNPDVGNDAAGNFVTVWEDNGHDGDGAGIYFRRFDSQGTALDTSDQLANQTTAGNQTSPAIATDKNGNFVIAWAGNGTQSGQTDDQGIFIRAFKKDGSPRGGEIKVNTTNRDEYMPDISMDYDNADAGGNFVVTWEACDTGSCSSTYDVYAQTFTVDFGQANPPVKIGTEITVSSDTTIRVAEEPSVAMNTHDDFIVSWYGTDDASPTYDQVWFKAYSSGNDIIQINGHNYNKVNSDTVTQAARPKIAVDKKTRTAIAGNFIITYDGISPEDSDQGIFARQVQCSGGSCSLNPVEMEVNSTISRSQTLADVESDYLGNFTIAWTSEVAMGTDVFAQSFSFNEGRPFGQIARVGTEFRVDSTDSFVQQNAAVAMNPDGQYVIVFDKGTGANNDIKYQQYVSDLFKVGTEMLTHPADNSVSQNSADVAVAPNGNHAAVWVNQSSPHGIFFSLWDNNNNYIAENIRVDSDDPSNVDANPSISFFKDTAGTDQGRFIIVWDGVAPPCVGSAAGKDVLYREVDASGNIAGSCETRVNATTANDQAKPSVAAGYYNNTGSEVEDIFAISYINYNGSGDPDNIIGAYHEDVDFTYNTINSTTCSSSYCGKTSVALNPTDNYITYVWDNADSTMDGVYGRQAVGASLSGPEFQINDTGSFTEYYPDVTFLAGNQFLTTFIKATSDYGFENIYAKRYDFNASGAPTTVDSQFAVSTGPNADSGPQIYGKVAADTQTGNFLVVWTDFPDVLENNQIYGQYYEYVAATTGGLSAFGPNFRINSTQSGSQSIPAAGMNDKGTAAVAWEGNVNQPGFIDTNGVAIQRLYDALYEPPYPALQPSAEQVITGGGRTLSVPASIQYPAATVSTTSTTTVQSSIRDATNGGSPIKYIEATDLDGAPFTISAVINNDFMLTPPGTTSYIPKTAASIRNWDQSTTDTDTACGPASPLTCVLTINSTARETTFQLSDTSESFVSLDTQRDMANKSGEHEIGKWRFYPDFKLDIPALTPPGNHTTSIIFSLT